MAGSVINTPRRRIRKALARSAVLVIAWEHHTGDVSDGRGEIRSTTAFEATPNLVNGRLYFPSPFNRIIALDPETGAEIWKFDHKVDLSSRYANQLVSRGVTYWEDQNGAGPNPKRIFAVTNDAPETRFLNRTRCCCALEARSRAARPRIRQKRIARWSAKARYR
ncbi:MAG: hypothetical protein AMXMBFR4_07340 [Candidatus Hydrogenedentota bacterium]